MSAVDYVLELEELPDADLADERFVTVLANTPVALTWREAFRVALEADESVAAAWFDEEALAELVDLV